MKGRKRSQTRVGCGRLRAERRKGGYLAAPRSNSISVCATHRHNEQFTSKTDNHVQQSPKSFHCVHAAPLPGLAARQRILGKSTHILFFDRYFLLVCVSTHDICSAWHLTSLFLRSWHFHALHLPPLLRLRVWDSNVHLPSAR